jgi:acetyl-CoA acyltransferase 1
MLRRTAGEILKKSPNDVVVLSAVRSPIARAFKGGFKDAYPEEILMPVSHFFVGLFASQLKIV